MAIISMVDVDIYCFSSHKTMRNFDVFCLPFTLLLIIASFYQVCVLCAWYIIQDVSNYCCSFYVSQPMNINSNGLIHDVLKWNKEVRKLLIYHNVLSHGYLVTAVNMTNPYIADYLLAMPDIMLLCNYLPYIWKYFIFTLTS